METVFQNDFCTVVVYPEKKIVHHTIHKFIFGENFRNMMTKAADAYEKYDCRKWLSDDRENMALAEEDIKWGQENWENRILKTGWDYWALVMPKKALGQLNMKPIRDRYKGMGVTVETFSDADEAMKWLESQD
ncbi:hypothetical protein JW906_11495 [bacterium]|nr:hypothetical protein [bacterium]